MKREDLKCELCHRSDPTRGRVTLRRCWDHSRKQHPLCDACVGTHDLGPSGLRGWELHIRMCPDEVRVALAFPDEAQVARALMAEEQ